MLNHLGIQYVILFCPKKSTFKNQVVKNKYIIPTSTKESHKQPGVINVMYKMFQSSRSVTISNKNGSFAHLMIWVTQMS